MAVRAPRGLPGKFTGVNEAGASRPCSFNSPSVFSQRAGICAAINQQVLACDVAGLR